MEEASGGTSCSYATGTKRSSSLPGETNTPPQTPPKFKKARSCPSDEKHVELIDLTGEDEEPERLLQNHQTGENSGEWEEYDAVVWELSGQIQVNIDASSPELENINPLSLAIDSKKDIKNDSKDESADVMQLDPNNDRDASPINEIHVTETTETHSTASTPSEFPRPISSKSLGVKGKEAKSSEKVLSASAMQVSSNKSFPRFMEIPEKVQKQIFQLLLLDYGRDMHPMYKEGIMKKGPWSGLNCEDIVEGPNITIPSLFFVSKKVSEGSRAVFYGTRTFHFKVADAAKWFLKNIGVENASFLRALVLQFQTGFIFSSNGASLEPCQERQWGQFIGLARRDPYKLNYHLKVLTVILHRWINVGKTSLQAEDREEIRKQRMRLIDGLKTFGGIKKVNIITTSEFLSQREANNLGLLMQQRVREEAKGPKKQVTLAELMEMCRLEKERERRLGG